MRRLSSKNTLTAAATGGSFAVTVHGFCSEGAARDEPRHDTCGKRLPRPRRIARKKKKKLK